MLLLAPSTKTFNLTFTGSKRHYDVESTPDDSDNDPDFDMYVKSTV